MFLFLASRAVHIEVTHQIDTDSFIQVIRRVIARRENGRLIQSDDSSNVLVAENELKMAFIETGNKKIANFFKTKMLIGLYDK